MASRKRRFTLDDKRRILELYDQLPRMSQRKASKRLNVSPSMLWTIIHSRIGIIKGENIKRGKGRWTGCGRSPKLEANIWKWIDQMRHEGIAINDLMIHRQSMDIAARMGFVNFRPSPRWYIGFKKREAILRERYHIYPSVDVKNEPEQLVSENAHCSASLPADAEPRQEPIMQEPIMQEPIMQEPIMQEPIMQEPITQEPITQEPITQEPITQEPITQEPITQEPITQEPITQEPSTQEPQEESVTVCEPKQQLPVQSKPTVLVGTADGHMHSVTVPSLHQMQEAMKTLATGLLYRGFCDFSLLHQFENEVANVVRSSKVQGCQESFVA